MPKRRENLAVYLRSPRLLSIPLAILGITFVLAAPLLLALGLFLGGTASPTASKELGAFAVTLGTSEGVRVKEVGAVAYFLSRFVSVWAFASGVALMISVVLTLVAETGNKRRK